MCGVGVCSMVVQSRKAEITMLCIYFRIKEQIACLDVSMVDNFLQVFVEVEETRCNAFYNVIIL